MVVDTLHPRPQLARDGWLDLCGAWSFAYDDADQGIDDGWQARDDVFDRTIRVPFPPESQASGIGDPAFHPILWYRRTVAVAAPAAKQRVVLHFGAVDYRAQVWVNGRLVATHEGGHTPFSADITTALRPDAEQILVVRAEDRPTDLTQPRGKQTWNLHPSDIRYHRTSGIWQPVWLETVATTYFTDLRWTPDLDRGVLDMQVQCNAAPDRPLMLRVQLTLHGATIAHDTYEMERSTLRRSLALDLNETMSRNRVLWSPAHPNLIDAELTLLDGEQVIDQVRSYAGLRGVGISNGRFLLNGRPYYLRLVLEQGYWPESHLAAPNDDALRREVELIKALGFNGVRIHQKVEDPRFLYWCDRLGLLVWGEMASSFVFSPLAIERLTREWLDVLRRDYSHPCIVTWVPFNESWGVPNLEHDPAQRDYVRGVYHLTKALDPTRPVIGNDGWEHFASDVWGIHDYAFSGATIRERYATPEAVERTVQQTQPHYRSIALPDTHRVGEPIMLTECGGLSFAPASGERWFGYDTATDAETFVAKYRDLIDAILESPTIAGFCYTQLTDTEQETNGLLRADRTPKIDVATIHSITNRPSAAIPGEVLAQVQAAIVTTFQPEGT